MDQEQGSVTSGSGAGAGGGNQDNSALVKEVLTSRSAFYRMLASLYFNPLTQEQVDNLASADLSVYAQMGDDFAQGADDMMRYLRKRNTGTRDELAADFTGAFVGTKSLNGKVAVPYESVFTSEEGLLYQESYHEVLAEFRRAAVSLAPGVDWPDDHLSFLFQFLAILSDRALQALEANDVQAARSTLSDSREFLRQHVARWFESFYELALQIVETRFYRGVLKITRGFIGLDFQTLEDLLEQLG